VTDDPAWHQALAFALLGRRRPDLGRQPAPDISQLVDALVATTEGEAPLAEQVGRARLDAKIWPFPVPVDLMPGIAAAQFRAALRELQTRCGIGPAQERRTIADRAPDAAERQLQRDVPPHHGQ
jgi:hypothetical protein